MRTNQGIKPSLIHKELEETIGGKDIPTYRTVARQALKYKEGSMEVNDQPKSGRPVCAFNDENIEAVGNLIEQNPYITYEMIRKETQLSNGVIQKIIHEELQLKKIQSRYIPHKLSEKQKQDRVDICQENLDNFKYGSGRLSDILTCDETWIFHKQVGLKKQNAKWISKDDHPPTIPKSKYSKKNLFSIFFNSQGVVHVNMIKQGKTINNEIYQEILNNAFMEIKKKRGLKGVLLLHDNARPHQHQNIKDFLKKHGVKQLKHPPYSPDVSPCDFWINGYIKRNLKDCESEDQLLESVYQICEQIPVCEYKKTFEKWLERLECCIQNKGEYFEHKL